MSKKKIVVGFDGFVDTLSKPIYEKGEGLNRYFETIDALGRYLCGQAGKNCSVEMDVLERKAGGNAPLLSIAADSLQMNVCLIGMLGLPDFDPMFIGLPFERYSYLPPGQSTALEFDDGKVFLAPGISTPDKPWELVNAATADRADEIFSGADVVALVNWSEISFAQTLWEGVLAALLPKPPDRRRHVLFDLCDCTRKPARDIESVISLIGQFSDKRRTILSMNENECLNVGAKLFDIDDCREISHRLHEGFEIDEVVVHAARWSLIVTDGVCCSQNTKFVRKPVISTGAGDNFNAAYAYCAAENIEIEKRLEFCHRFAHAYIKGETRPTNPKA